MGTQTKDIRDHAVVDIAIEWEADKDAAFSWFNDNFRIKSLANDDVYEARSHRVSVGKVKSELEAEGPISPRIGKLISIYANAEERLSLTKAVNAIDLAESQPEHPVHILAGDSDLIEKLSTLAEKAFGADLTLDTSAVSTFVLRLGKPDVAPSFNRHGIPSREYMAALRQLPTLENQGHGIRSYIGMLMELLVGSNLVVLVDEPEAFLHPPQAEKIGSAISALKNELSQVFVATHDANVVKGFLASKEAEDVVVIRIRRSGEKNPVAVLKPGDLEALWSDPSLRYSNVLDGLFSEGTVVCEGDPDCRLYQSATDALDETGARGIHFTQGGGSGRISVIASALTAVSVPTVAIVDLDLLGQRPLLKRIVEAVGGSWQSSWEPLLNTVESGVLTLSQSPTKATIVKAVNESLTSVNEEDVPPNEALKRIAAVAKKTTGWQRLKEGGKAVLPGGNCTSAFETMVEEFANQGVFLVPVGELERWFPMVGGHGPAHVSEVHERGLIETAAGHAVKEFVERIRTHLSK